MTDTITMYVRNVRGIGGAGGHLYFVYQHDGATPVSISLTSADGMSGINGGPSQVSTGPYVQGGSVDYPKIGENHYVVRSMSGADLSQQWSTINQTYQNLAQHPYYFLSQNDNAAAGAAVQAIDSAAAAGHRHSIGLAYPLHGQVWPGTCLDAHRYVLAAQAKIETGPQRVVSPRLDVVIRHVQAAGRVS